MLKDALKWIFLALLIVTVVVAAMAVIDHRLNATPVIEQADLPALTSAPTSAPTPTPVPTPTPTPTPSPSPTPLSDEARIEIYMRDMSLEDKLGQLVIFGFTGSRAPSSEFTAVFSEYRVGNYMLYGQNIYDGDGDGGFHRAATLTAALESGTAGDIPPLIGIDVEGGSVVRFGWEKWPSSARTLGKSDDTERARAQFVTIGEKLLETGINLNLAPVLDVSADPMSTFLGNRIISGDEQVAAAIGAAAIEGLDEAGCLSAAKHFPGHGGTKADSHATTPVVKKSLDEMLAYDLVPFTAGVEAGVDVMLVAHIFYPQLDENDIASMSYPIITELLREQLGFTGVVMSDDFRMGGLTSRYTTENAALRFFEAGGDLILCGARSWSQRAIMQTLRAAAADGRLSQERIDESVFRILFMKYRQGLWSPEDTA